MLLVLTYWSLGFVLSLFVWSKKLGREGIKSVLYKWLCVTPYLVILICIENILNGSKISYKVLDWLYVLDIPFVFEYNKLSSSMIILIELISTLVLWYISGYSFGDLGYVRLIGLVLGFKISMLWLVMGSNLLSLFVGWELVGIVSFGLIIYWYTSMSNSKSAIQAMLMNKVGDICILLVLFILYKVLGGVEITLVFVYFEENWMFLVYLMLLVGSFAKSGQIGLHFWLPNAMAAPTPISALLHSATMVTAGVYLSIITGLSSKYLILIGSYSLLVLGSFGLIEYDYKRTIAYSTGSQLAYMFVGVGLGLYTLSFFHLLVHAVFKSTLFLSSGLVLYVCSDEQDIRSLGGLKSLVPLGYMASVVGTLSILGFPFMGAYYSKEWLVLGSWLVDYDGWFLLVFGVLFTSYYSYRVFDRVYGGLTKLGKNVINEYSLESIPIYIVLFFMSQLVIYWGYLLTDIYNGLIWGNDTYIMSEFVGWLNDIMVGLMVIGIMLTVYLSKVWIYIMEKYYQSWGFEVIYKNCLVKVYTWSDKTVWRLSDKGINEGLFIWGWWSVKKYKWYSHGLLYDYILLIILYGLVILWIL